MATNAPDSHATTERCAAAAHSTAPDSAAGGLAPSICWRLRLLGGFELHCTDDAPIALPGRAVALLLARLAMWPERCHAREELIELLWPGASPAVGRDRFRPVLSSLRGLLARHVSGDPRPWLQTDRSTVRLRPAAVVCDVVELRRRWDGGDKAAGRLLADSVLLPGHYDDWVVEERARLQNLAATKALPVSTSGPPVARSASLPPRLGSLFGRSADLEALTAALRRHRLVTLRGAPGVGKTRLAEEVAHRQARDETVVFVDLAGCNVVTQIPQHLRLALQLGPDDADERLAERIGPGPSLCILDHAEHLVGQGAASAFRRLLGCLPALRLLVVSRRALQWPGAGEQVLAVLPLPLPDCCPADAVEQPAVAMFMERTRAVRIAFWLHAGTMPLVISICRALAGLPLAIALAATGARTRTLGELQAALAAGVCLDEALGLSPAALDDDRAHSMASAIEHSWRLLDDSQRRFAAALAAEPRALDAAAAALSTGLLVPEVHQRLSGLVEDSLLDVIEAADGQLRFAVPPSIRDFVLRRLPHDQQPPTRAVRVLGLVSPQRAA